jgi:hypothetical protein
VQRLLVGLLIPEGETMKRGALVIGLMLVGSGVLVAQDGVYVGSGTEFGVVLRMGGGQLSVEPGVYLAFNRSSTDQDPSEFRSRAAEAGLAAQLRWLAAPAVVVTPVAALRVTMGKMWTRYESESPLREGLLRVGREGSDARRPGRLPRPSQCGEPTAAVVSHVRRV